MDGGDTPLRPWLGGGKRVSDNIMNALPSGVGCIERERERERGSGRRYILCLPCHLYIQYGLAVTEEGGEGLS